jgi:hypothetical protein
MAITYKLRPGFSGGGSIGYGKFGNSFDVGAALVAGAGSFVVTDADLVAKLDQYAPVFRFADDGVPLVAFELHFRTLSLGGLVQTTEIVEQIQIAGELFPRLIIKGDGTILTGNGTVSPTTPVSGGSAHTITDEGGAALTQRGTLNFTGAGVTATDNSGAGRTDVTIPGGGGSGYATVQDEGGALTQRTTLNFIGAGVSAVDNAGSTRTDVTISGGAGTLPWVDAATYGFAQGASAATIKTSLVNAIAALPAAGGTVVLADADVTIDLSASPVQIGTRAVRIIGGGNTRLKCSNESTTSTLTMFSLAGAGGTIILENMRLEGPDALGVGGQIDLVSANSSSASGRITAINCQFAKFTYALRCTSSVNWAGWIEAYYCKFTGYNSSTQASTPILVNTISTGATGRGVRMVACEFRSFGLGSSNLYHAMYIATDWDLEVDRCHFITSIGTGWSIQVYDSAAPANTASTNQRITNCHFYAALTVRGVLFANKSRGTIQGCAFDNVTPWISFNNANGTAAAGGGGEILDNWFTGVNLSGSTGIDIDAAGGGDQGVRVARNRFTGGAAIIISTGLGYWTIEDNDFAPFTGTPPNTCIDALPGAAPTKIVIKGNTFRGTTTQWIWNESGGTMLLTGNYFWQTAGTSYRNSSTGTVQRLVGNDFSQASGASVLNSSTPTTYQAKANYGSVGLADV